MVHTMTHISPSLSLFHTHHHTPYTHHLYTFILIVTCTVTHIWMVSSLSISLCLSQLFVSTTHCYYSQCVVLPCATSVLKTSSSLHPPEREEFVESTPSTGHCTLYEVWRSIRVCFKWLEPCLFWIELWMESEQRWLSGLGIMGRPLFLHSWFHLKLISRERKSVLSSHVVMLCNSSVY